MSTPFLFTLSRPAGPEIRNELARALEKHVELEGRNKCPRLWAVTDRLNSRDKASAQIRTLRTVVLLFLWFVSVLLIMPSLLDPKALAGPLAVSCCVFLYASFVLFFARPKLFRSAALPVGVILLFVGAVSPQLRSQLILAAACLLLGLLCLFSGKSSSRRFLKAADSLLAGRKALLENAPVRVIFDEAGLHTEAPACPETENAAPQSLSGWGEILYVIETASLYLIFTKQTVTFLEKKDLAASAASFEELVRQHTRLISLE